jgi:hypothetical protein
MRERFQKVMETTIHAQLEDNFEMNDIKTSFVMGPTGGINFTQSVKKYKN